MTANIERFLRDGVIENLPEILKELADRITQLEEIVAVLKAVQAKQ